MVTRSRSQGSFPLLGLLIPVFCGFCKGVMCFDQLSERLVENVGIDLGGGNVLMAQQFLDDAEIGAIGEKMAGKGVAYDMRRERVCGNSGPRAQALEIARENLPGKIAGRTVGG